jgi:two-component system, NtrC family, response regulator AtoC
MTPFIAPDGSAQPHIEEGLHGLPPSNLIFGNGKAMQAVRHKAEKVAGTNVPVLIQGENGTGKEVLAKLIHTECPWRDGPFVKVSCPAIPATLIESELFGYERGAFTGALATKPGRVELADQGSLFLDEIAELDSGLQAKLLHLLQDGQFSRIGGREDKKVEVRIICATNRDLRKEIEAGTFRRDLYYRINVVNIHLPPLRERPEDIPVLLDYFLAFYAEKYNARPRPLSTQALKMLLEYDWPGNIRQLENLIRRYVILGSEESVTSELVHAGPKSEEAEFPLDGTRSLRELTRDAVQNLERKIILHTLQTHHWNRKRAARTLKISYRALLYKIDQAGLPSRRNGGGKKAALPPAPQPD